MMPRYILKLQGKKKTSYMIYSTIVDAPIIYDMTEDEVRAYWKNEYGEQGMRGFEEMMEKVKKTGTSTGETPRELLAGNRAGKGEKELAFKEIIAIYVDLTKAEK